VLESFRKAASERQEKAIERPKEILRADEKGLIHVLLSENESNAAAESQKRSLIAEMAGAAIMERVATRRIFQAIRALDASEMPVTFSSVNARLEENDQSLLAEVLFAEETGEEQQDFAYGRRCLESLLRSDEQLRRTELKAQVKQAERAGNVREALRLAEELAQLERRGGARA
jgi:hypothetical protein